MWFGRTSAKYVQKQQLWSCCTQCPMGIAWRVLFPVILVAAKEPVAGPTDDPAWMGGRLGELRRWERPEMMGRSQCGRYWVTTQAVSPARWVWVADDITCNPQWINAGCLIGDECISVFHWNLQEICRQTMLLFPSQPPVEQEILLCERPYTALSSMQTWHFRVSLQPGPDCCTLASGFSWHLWVVCPSLTCMSEPGWPSCVSKASTPRKVQVAHIQEKHSCCESCENLLSHVSSVPKEWTRNYQCGKW